MATAVFSVPGISCGHCVAAITEEVGAVAGVDSVTVDLESKLVTVEGEVEAVAVVATIDEAGYEVEEPPEA